MGQTIPIVWVNAFTRQAFGGNPAVVVPDAEGLEQDMMQNIAREVNCSETAFILTSRHPEADLKIRWFTPSQEVKLCGHATVAALHALCEAGRFNLLPGSLQILYLDTLSGVLPVTIDFTHQDAAWIWLTVPAASLAPLSDEQLKHIGSALSCSQPYGTSKGPRVIEGVVDSLNRDVLLKLESLDQLQTLSPHYTELAALGEKEQWRGFCTFTTETIDPDNTAHVRFFAPQAGIDEDPVTGSVSAPLGQYLKQSDKSLGDVLRVEQGNSLGRPGRVHVSLQDPSPKIGGQAITLLTGAFQL